MAAGARFTCTHCSALDDGGLVGVAGATARRIFASIRAPGVTWWMAAKLNCGARTRRPTSLRTAAPDVPHAINVTAPGAAGPLVSDDGQRWDPPVPPCRSLTWSPSSRCGEPLPPRYVPSSFSLVPSGTSRWVGPQNGPHPPFRFVRLSPRTGGHTRGPFSFHTRLPRCR